MYCLREFFFYINQRICNTNNAIWWSDYLDYIISRTCIGIRIIPECRSCFSSHHNHKLWNFDKPLPPAVQMSGKMHGFPGTWSGIHPGSIPKSSHVVSLLHSSYSENFIVSRSLLIVIPPSSPSPSTHHLHHHYRNRRRRHRNYHIYLFKRDRKARKAQTLNHLIWGLNVGEFRTYCRTEPKNPGPHILKSTFLVLNFSSITIHLY